ncbi:MAG: nucleotidyltransferase family protein [Nanoarchaeota archaeon]
MLQKCTILKVARVFFDEPTKNHYLKEICRKANLAHTSVKNKLDELIDENIIEKKIEKKGEREFPYYYANRNNTYFKYKKIDNYLRILNSGLIEFLRDKLMPSTIILFGSYSKGEDIEDSDIDLFLECNEKNIDLGKFEGTFSRDIQIHFSNDFNSFSKELKNNILNGITLYGNVEAFK